MNVTFTLALQCSDIISEAAKSVPHFRFNFFLWRERQTILTTSLTVLTIASNKKLWERRKCFELDGSVLNLCWTKVQITGLVFWTLLKHSSVFLIVSVFRVFNLYVEQNFKTLGRVLNLVETTPSQCFEINRFPNVLHRLPAKVLVRSGGSFLAHRREVRDTWMHYIKEIQAHSERLTEKSSFI